MSLILDALNKADQEKEQQGEVPDLQAKHYEAEKFGAGKEAIVIEKKHLFVGGILAALGVTVIVLLTLLLTREGGAISSPDTASPDPARAPTAVSDAPVEPVRPTSEPEAAAPSVSAPGPSAERPLAASTSDDPAFGRQMLTPLDEKVTLPGPADDEVAALYKTQVDETPQRIVAPKVAPAAPSRPAVDRQQVAQLWQEMNQSRPVQLPPGVEIEALPDRPSTSAGKEAEPEIPAGLSEDESILGQRDIPFLHELPVAFQDTIPTLMYNKHAYTQGFVIINKKRYHEGDTLAGGILLEALLADGVLLRFNDRAFKLGSESSWVNY